MHKLFFLLSIFCSFCLMAKISVISVNGGGSYGCIANEKKGVCFGGLTNLPRDLVFENIKNIEGGYRHICVHHNDQVDCFARNIGNPNTKISGKITNIKKMTVGISHSCVLKNDDSVECWGEPRSNQIKIPSDLKDIQEFVAGSYTNCAVLGKERELRCFGEYNNRTLRFPENFKNIQKVSVGHRFVCVVRKIQGVNKLECYSRTNSAVVSGVPKDFGEIDSLYAGYGLACAKNKKNELTCWGQNSGGLPVNTKIENVSKVSIQGNGLCYVTLNEDFKCHGLVSNFSPVLIKESSKIKRVVTTSGGTCVLVNGKYSCVGSFKSEFMQHLNSLSKSAKIFSGHLNLCSIDGEKFKCSGIGNGNRLTIPEEVVSPDRFLIGTDHICVVQGKNSVICWGSNDKGQITKPKELGKIEKFSVGYQHNCAVDEKGPICWGENRFGQSRVPRDIYSKNVIDIISGANSSCALIDNGSYECWGQITQDEEDFINFNAGEIKNLFLRNEYTCLQTINGLAKCFGKNNSEQVNVPKLKGKVKQMSVGGDHSCLVSENNNLKCWGSQLNNKRSILIGF